MRNIEKECLKYFLKELKETEIENPTLENISGQVFSNVYQYGLAITNYNAFKFLTQFIDIYDYNFNIGEFAEIFDFTNIDLKLLYNEPSMVMTIFLDHYIFYYFDSGEFKKDIGDEEFEKIVDEKGNIKDL